MRARSTLRTLGPVGAIVALLVVSSYAGAAAAAAPASRASSLQEFDSHIDHIVFLMEENHAFDSIYGDYCQQVTKYCWSTANGVPNTCLALNPANASQGCVYPYNFTSMSTILPDMEHDWYSTHSAWNSGAMNNFYYAEGTKNTFGHYNASTVPFYYDLAEEYGLADNFFSGDASYSDPNHWDMFTDTPPNVSQQNYILASTSVDEQYLNESNQTVSLESQLVNSSISWKYYDYQLYNYNNSITNYGTFNYWNPLAARAQSYSSAVHTHFAAQSGFFSDASAGKLPDLSWVIPNAVQSDHPGSSSPLDGQDFVASVVDAVEASPDWNSTVLFITWDEYGGFYDQVAPPYLDANGAGFRVPLLAVGPWVRQGSIDHVAMNFASILHLMEDRFGFTCMGTRDCTAKLPLGMFNFARSTPRAPIGFATNGTWRYPMPLQSQGGLPYYAPTAAPTAPSYPPQPAAKVIDWG